MKITRPKSKQPIPSHAKKVFQGEIFDVYQWPQKMYDGTTQTFEKIQRADTATIIPITEDGKIITSKQSQPGKKPFSSTIGGRIDKEENPLDAAKRELLEETGYVAKEWILLDSIQPYSKIEWTVYCFIAKGCTKITKQNLDSGEKIKLNYLSFENFVNIVLQKDFGDVKLKIKILEAKLDPKKMNILKKLMGIK
jgi:ADP-ribose pyrophosphatase